uniref:cytochrome-b5 reductase n=1 Tax=Mesocestoides corti TaxID=53468 RepID=A0A0R3UIZ1_MESCO
LFLVIVIPDICCRGIGYWNSYTRSTEYLDLQPENAPISEDELSKHTSIDDMWIALQNNHQLEVYDVTRFAEFHPGGSKVISQHAGTDASEAFRCLLEFLITELLPELEPDLRSIRIHPHSVGLVRDPCVHIDLRCTNNSSKMLLTSQNDILEHKIISLNDLCSPASCVSHVRPYTPTCTNFLREADSAVEFELLIKVYENGTVSTILDKTKEGSTVEVSLPMGCIEPSVLLNCVGDEFRAWNRIYMLCAGSGVTPFLPVIQRIINLHQTSVRLLWFNRKLQDVILSQELENLASCAGNRFAVHHWLEIQPEDSVPCLPNSAIGRVGEALCYKFFGHFDDVTAASTLCLICGPPGFNTSAKE